LQENSNDPLILAALQAANKSYAPYSQDYSGTALLTTDGKIYTGQYAENAAFNPSMSPLQSALAQMNVGGNLYQDIKRAVLVERLPSASLCSQLDTTRSLLKSVSKVKLEVVYLAKKAKVGHLGFS
jgi:cytidine deaminase